MSYNVGDLPPWSNPFEVDPCELAEQLQPTSANIEALNQQYDANGFPENELIWLLSSEGKDSSFTGQNDAAYAFSGPAVPKMESASSGSSPSSHGRNVSPDMRNDRVAKPRKAAKAKKPFLDETETELLEKDDALLSEKELAIKKRAQNRLAQRAFRERKEQKLKELEDKLLRSEEERQKLLEKLEEIKGRYISMRTENQFLRLGPEVPRSDGAESKFIFPKSQQEFVNEMVVGQNHEMTKANINKIYDEPQNPGRKVLAVGAVWDYLQIKREEEQYENVDMFEVMQLLKGNEACHGYGPAYPLDLVEAALRRVAQEQE